EDAASVGEDVVASKSRIEERLDARPRRLHPAQARHRRNELTEERRLAEREIEISGAGRRGGGIGGRRDARVGQIRGRDRIVIRARVARQDQQTVHGREAYSYRRSALSVLPAEGGAESGELSAESCLDAVSVPGFVVAGTVLVVAFADVLRRLGGRRVGPAAG